jgi:subtilase-type serine protease
MRCWMLRIAFLSMALGFIDVAPADAAPPTEVSYATLDYKGPGAINTFLTGIRGQYIVGLYTTSSNASHGLIYDVTTQTWKQLDVYVGGVAVPSTSPYGPDPVTGGSSLDHGFYYDSTKPLTSAFVYLDFPSTSQATTLNTIPHSIYGNQIVGNYDTSLKTGNAFLYNISTKTYTNIDKPNDSRLNPTLSTTAYGDLGEPCRWQLHKSDRNPRLSA